jgi:uncharacterized damage-inducible protein DinB
MSAAAFDWALPPQDACAPFYHNYLNHNRESGVRAALEASGRERMDALLALKPGQLNARYARGKWSVGMVFRHMLDTEAVFRGRMLAFAREPGRPQAGFNQDHWAETGPQDQDQSLLIRDAALERQCTLALLDQLLALDAQRRQTEHEAPSLADQKGMADGRPMGIAAAAAIIAGHDRHHLQILIERYGLARLSS